MREQGLGVRVVDYAQAVGFDDEGECEDAHAAYVEVLNVLEEEGEEGFAEGVEVV